jgi:peroxiredoxin Q/BCP
MIESGQPFPDFELAGVDASGTPRTFTLADLVAGGKPVVVYAYPKDDTPGCTTEACDFRDQWPARTEDVLVVGLSPDSVASHQKFHQKYGLNFPLLSDPDRQLMSAIGAFGEKTMYGKKVTGVIRSTYLIAPDRVLRRAWRNVKAKGHAQQVLAALS